MTLHPCAVGLNSEYSALLLENMWILPYLIPEVLFLVNKFNGSCEEKDTFIPGEIKSVFLSNRRCVASPKRFTMYSVLSSALRRRRCIGSGLVKW